MTENTNRKKRLLGVLTLLLAFSGFLILNQLTAYAEEDCDHWVGEGGDYKYCDSTYHYVTGFCTECDEKVTVKEGHSCFDYDYKYCDSKYHYATGVCELCNEKFTVKKPHVYEDVFIGEGVKIDDTYHATELYICICGDYNKIIQKEKHDWGDWEVTKKATCSEQGKKKRECWSCGAIQTKTIPTKEHDWGDWEVTKKAVCGKPGLKKRYCSKCETVQTKTVNTGDKHDWVETSDYKSCNGKYHYSVLECWNCGTKKSEKEKHDWGDWEVTKKATCTNQGKKEKECLSCGATQKKTIPAKKHRFKKDGVELAPNSKTKVRSIYICKDCGKTKFKKTKSMSYASKIKKLPQAKLTGMLVNDWFGYKKAIGDYKPKNVYYDNGSYNYRSGNYLKCVDLKCRKESGNLKYQFAFKKKGDKNWDYTSYGKDRSIMLYDLPRNRTVYAKVRVYTVKNGVKIYGKWSPVETEITYDKEVHANNVYCRNQRYVKGYIKGAAKGEIIKVVIGKKTFTSKVKKNAKKYPFKINIGKTQPGKKIKIILCSKLNDTIYTYSDTIWYSRKIGKGFTKNQVRYTWGSPDSTSSASGGWKFWHWEDGSYVDFKNGRVKYWYNAAE